MKWGKPVKIEFDGRWYHGENVAALMIIFMVAGFIIGWVSRSLLILVKP